MSANELPEDLKSAILDLDEESVGDFVYTIRERVDMSELPKGASSWDHPRVVAWGDAAAVLAKYAKELRR